MSIFKLMKEPDDYSELRRMTSDKSTSLWVIVYAVIKDNSIILFSSPTNAWSFEKYNIRYEIINPKRILNVQGSSDFMSIITKDDLYFIYGEVKDKIEDKIIELVFRNNDTLRIKSV